MGKSPKTKYNRKKSWVLGSWNFFFQPPLILRTFFHRTFTANFFYFFQKKCLEQFLRGYPSEICLDEYLKRCENTLYNMLTLLNLMLLSFIHTSVQSTLWQGYGHGTKRKMCNCTLYTEIQIGMKIVHSFSRPGRLWSVATLVFLVLAS